MFREVTIGPCRLINADCMEVLPTLAGVDAVVTDPPYGIKHASNRGASWWNELVKHNNSGRFLWPFFVVRLDDGEFVAAQAKVE